MDLKQGAKTGFSRLTVFWPPACRASTACTNRDMHADRMGCDAQISAQVRVSMITIFNVCTFDSVLFATFADFSHTKMCCGKAGSVEHDQGLSKVQRSRIAKLGTIWRKIAV
jgi:hypothetical protein